MTYFYCVHVFVMQGGSTITAPLPPWLWDGMASFAPEVAKLACEGLDLSSAAAYFQVTRKLLAFSAYSEEVGCSVVLGSCRLSEQ